MDIKMEYDNICHGCLSAERNIQLVTGEICEMFYKLRDDDNQFYGDQLVLCWECFATVKKLKTFQDRIKRAQVLLQDHMNTYCITGESKALSCLSSLTKMLNNSIDEAFCEEENLNREEQFNNPNNLNNKPHTIAQERSRSRNLKKEVNAINSEMNTKDLPSDEECKEICIEFKPECKYIIKQEENGLENDNNDMDNEEEDNLSNTDCREVEIKGNQKESVSTNVRKSNIYSFSKRAKKRRRYLKYAKITKNESISAENYNKIFEKIHFNQDEYDDVLNKERDRLRNRLKLKCEDCKVTFLKNLDLLRHVSFVHNKSAFPQKCAACETIISSKENLSQHWTRVHTIMLRCTLCSHLHRTVTDMREHIRLSHTCTYTCITCDCSYSTMAEFLKHYKFHEVVICDLCGINFRNKKALIKHIKSAHSPVPCKFCSNSYATRAGYWYHLRIRHPESIKLETNQELSYCVECDKQFPSLLKYKRHLQRSVKHVPKKIVRVPCPECGKIFSKKTFMNNHYRFAHLKVTKHHCEQCDKYYTTGFGLRVHIERVHEKIPAPKNKFCDMCGRGFATNKMLDNHRRTHTGEKPFKCAYCPAAFGQQSAMLSHQKSQHNADKIIKILK